MRNFNDALRKHSQELEQLIRKDLPKVISVEAKSHFKENFIKGGFVDKNLQKWKDVKRRNPQSPWYGHEPKGEHRDSYAFSRGKDGKTYKSKNQRKLNFSKNATERSPLTSRRNALKNNLNARASNKKIIVFSTLPYAKIQNEGGEIKVFGKHRATIPARKFMGHSEALDKKIEKEFTTRITNIFKSN